MNKQLIETTREGHASPVSLRVDRIVETVMREVLSEHIGDADIDLLLAGMVSEIVLNHEISAPTLKSFENVLKNNIDIVIEMLDFNERNSI